MFRVNREVNAVNDWVPGPASSNDDDGSLTFPTLDLLNKMQYLRFSGERMEHFIRNGISVKMLIEQEASGLGHLTITDLLDALQYLRTTGQSDNFDDLTQRRIPVNPAKTDLQKENEAYRHILEHMMREFNKKSIGYQSWAEAIRILLERIDNKQYD
ncbi:hypothetical protein [Paenibacillus taichungensis]